MVWIFALGLILAFAIVKDGAVMPLDAVLCFAATGVAAVINSWKRTRTLPPRWAPMLAALPAIALLQLVPLPLPVVSLLSPARARSLEGIEGLATLSFAPAATLHFAVRIAAAVLMFLLVRETVRRRGLNPWLAAAPLIALGALEAMLGLAQRGAGMTPDGATGTYVNRNHFAGLLEMCLPLAVGAAIHHFRKPAIFCTSGAAALFMLAGVFSSLSRAGLAATAAAIVALAWFEVPARRRVYVLVPAGLFVAAFLLLAPARMGERIAGGDLSFAARLEIWGETLSLTAGTPLIGCGLGAFESGLQAHRHAVPDFRVDFAHNDYLQILAEAGLPGALAICALLLSGIANAAKAVRFPAGRAAASACLALLVHSLADFNLYIPANLLVFAWLAGITAGLVRSPSTPYSSKDRARVHSRESRPPGIPLPQAAQPECGVTRT